MEVLGMNGFRYVPQNKTITITDNSFVVIWENVEPEVGFEVGKMYHSRDSQKTIDTYLFQHNCKRFWGNNSPKQ
jgi:hypothetical protein